MDLATHYLGLKLRNPLVASASPLNAHLDNLKKLQDFGAGAVVLPSVFEEQIIREQEILDALIDRGAESFGECNDIKRNTDSPGKIQRYPNGGTDIDTK